MLDAELEEPDLTASTSAFAQSRRVTRVRVDILGDGEFVLGQGHSWYRALTRRFPEGQDFGLESLRKIIVADTPTLRLDKQRLPLAKVVSFSQDEPLARFQIVLNGSHRSADPWRQGQSNEQHGDSRANCGRNLTESVAALKIAAHRKGDECSEESAGGQAAHMGGIRDAELHETRY